MTTPDTVLTTRHATVADLVALLQAQHAAKLDVVTPARQLAADNGRLRLIGVGEPRLTPDGVTVGETVLRPTATADAGIADKLGIPLPYLRRLRAEQVASTTRTSTPGWPTSRTAGSWSAGCTTRTTRPGLRGRSCRTPTAWWTTSTS